MSLLDRYLPEAIRAQIEERYYARINAQARLEQLVHDASFLANPRGHMALISDHGVVHVRDVAQQVVHVLNTIVGVLIPARSPERLEFMRGYGVMAAYIHDIGMADFSAFGRAVHPEYATQAVLGPEFDDTLDTLWNQNCGNIPRYLIRFARGHDPYIMLREMLAMANCHSKSRVPVEVLNDPAHLRRVMQQSTATDQRYQYHEQQVAMAQHALAHAQQAERDPTEIEQLAAALQEAEAASEACARSGKTRPRLSEQLIRAYVDFERDSFRWLNGGESCELVQDVVDTLRALRCADALRQRGSVLKTSGHYEVFVDQKTANAIFALRQQDDRLFLLETPDFLSAGEANIAGSELGKDGNLRISFHRGAFGDQVTTQRAAYCAALVVNDVQADVIESFQRPMPADCKAADEIEILLEGVNDNFEFADLVLHKLRNINPRAAARARAVPSLQNTSVRELARYLGGDELDWDMARRQQALERIAQSGHKTQDIDPVRGFEDVRLVGLEAGQVLIESGSPAGFVYIPLTDGLQVIPLGGYQPLAVRAWMPLGITGVIRGATRNATVVAEQEVRLLMIPKQVYLKHWHRTYSPQEFGRLFGPQQPPAGGVEV